MDGWADGRVAGRVGRHDYVGCVVWEGTTLWLWIAVVGKVRKGRKEKERWTSGI